MKKVYFLTFYFLSPIFLIRVLYGIQPDKYQNMAFFLPMCLGVAAYNWFIWQFILSARPKFLDRLMGLDKIYRLHGIMALVSIGFVLVHQWLFEDIFQEGLLTFIGNASLIIYGGVSFLSVMLITKKIWTKWPIVGSIHRRIKELKVFRYEHHMWLHNLTIFALILMQVHVLMTSSARKYPIVFTIYMVYFISALCFYVYHKVLRPWLLEDHVWEVASVTKVSDQVRHILIDTNGETMVYAPGQFGYFRLFVSGHNEEHPFSFTSEPTEIGQISIAVKALGDFTSQLDRLRPGDKVIVDGPYGDFTYTKHPDEEESFFVAGGVGVTPVFSMIKHMSQMDPSRKVTLLLGMQTEKDFLFRKEFEAFQRLMPHLKVVPVVSKDLDYSGETGYIDAAKLQKYMDNDPRQAKGRGYYICGPKIMMESTKKHLKLMGVRPHRIHYESFSL